MNSVILMGRLTKDPDVRTSTGGLDIARYTLAVDRRFKRDGEPTADFIQCAAFGKTASFAEKYLKKGVKIAISGRLQTGSYDGKNGKVFTTEVIVETQEFCESKAENTPPVTSARNDDSVTVPDGIDEELPFAGV